MNDESYNGYANRETWAFKMFATAVAPALTGWSCSDALWKAQAEQDIGRTWGEALAAFDRAVGWVES